MPSFFRQLLSMTIAAEENKPDLRQEIMQDITGFNRPKPKPEEAKKEAKHAEETPKKKGWGWGRKVEAEKK